MKNKIAVNSKFFSRTQAKGLMSHVKREFEVDKNVLDSKLSRDNFGNKTDYINKRYDEALDAMADSVKNSLIDSVLVFPLDAFEDLKKNDKNWRDKIHKSINAMMKEMEQEMGFKPIGYKMHLDEGHIDKESGKQVLNPHAHMLFANVCVKDVTIKKTKKITQKDEHGKAMKDPKKPSKWLYERDEEGEIKTETVDVSLQGRAPLSHYQSRGKDSAWSRQQDIAAKHLKHLGFERGESAEITKAKHLSKEKHIAKKLKAAEAKLKDAIAAANAVIPARESYFTALLNEDIDLELEVETQERFVKSINDIVNEEVKKEVIDSSQERLNDLKPDFNFSNSLETAQNTLDNLKEKTEKEENTRKQKLKL